MAIKKETLAALLVSVGAAADAAAATTMIDDTAEHAPAIPEGTLILSKDQAVTRDKAQYEKGKKAGTGMSIDGIFEKELPEYTGKKDTDTLVAALLAKGQGEAGKDVNVKITERDNTIATLRKNIQTMEATATQQAQDMKKKDTMTTLLMWTADKKPDHLTNEEWVGLLSMGIEVVDGTDGDAGKQFAKRNGTYVEDAKLATKIPAKDAVLAYIDERKIGKAPAAAAGGAGGGGRGAGDSKGAPAGIRTKSQFEAYCGEQKIPLNGKKAQDELKRITTEVTDFDWNA